MMPSGMTMDSRTPPVGAPEVSVIVPTRDREVWLPRTLLSSLRQQEVRAEIIVVDDGSRVPVERRLSEYGRSRCTVLRFEDSQGVAAARNAGAGAAGGKWLAFLDDDDVWAPTKLARVINTAVEAGADFGFSSGVLIDAAGRVRHAQTPPRPDEGFYRAMLRSLQVPYPSSNLVLKATAFRSIGGFDEHLAHTADWDLLIRLSANASAAMTPEHLVAYTVHGANMQFRDGAIAHELRYIKSKYASARRELGVSIDRAWWLHWRADARRLAGERLGTASAYLQLGWLERDPRMVARAVILLAGGERSMTVMRHLAGERKEAGEWPEPPWLARAARPSPSDIAAIWR